MIVENFTQYQPRFRAWLRSLGVIEGSSVMLFEYMSWVSRKADEYMSIAGITFFNEGDHVNFTEWLLREADANEIQRARSV
ncbi:hypothetical protein [Paenibacillus sp. FSL K6-2859]|uniref:hypothetical protein n=1 Tax=Paenibacillus sp. FSL K6-2859 TaxID=2921482 RepID=UPI0030F78440